jgi:hypothetical protein
MKTLQSTPKGLLVPKSMLGGLGEHVVATKVGNSVLIENAATVQARQHLKKTVAALRRTAATAAITPKTITREVNAARAQLATRTK